MRCYAPSRGGKHGKRCLRCLLLVMCTHPFAKEALTLHLAHSEGHERYFGCNLLHPKALALSHQHLMAEAPNVVLTVGSGQFALRTPEGSCEQYGCVMLSKRHVGQNLLRVVEQVCI